MLYSTVVYRVVKYSAITLLLFLVLVTIHGSFGAEAESFRPIDFVWVGSLLFSGLAIFLRRFWISIATFSIGATIASIFTAGMIETHSLTVILHAVLALFLMYFYYFDSYQRNKLARSNVST